jgi:hypothetical protein
MLHHLIRVILAGSLLLAVPALAADPASCACGQPGAQCQQPGCACTQADGGQCPMAGQMGKGMGMGMGGPHRMGPGPMMGGMAAFDAKTVETFKATVTAVERMERGPGMVGVHLRVAVGAETRVVHLGPAAYVDPKMTFAEKDEVEVTGSRVTLAGEPAVLATTVKKGGKALELRKADGAPLFRMPMK